MTSWNNQHCSLLTSLDNIRVSSSHASGLNSRPQAIDYTDYSIRQNGVC